MNELKQKRYELIEIAHRQRENMKRLRDEVMMALTWNQFNQIHIGTKYGELQQNVSKVSKSRKLLNKAAKSDYHWETYVEATRQLNTLTDIIYSN